MTRKDYEEIAASFRWQGMVVDSFDDDARVARGVLHCLASELCRIWRNANPRFNSAKFMTQAGF